MGSVSNQNTILAESHGLGMLILIGISPDDTAEDIEYLVKKATQLRIFDDSWRRRRKATAHPTSVPPAPRSPSPSMTRSFEPLRSDSDAPSARVASAPTCRYL